MIKRCRIKDLDYVNNILRHKSIYSFISDDGSPSIEEYTIQPLLEYDLVYVLSPNKYTIILAIPITCSTYEFHVNMIAPHGRGKNAIESTAEVVEWLFDNTPCQKLTSWIPEINMNVVKFALANGMQMEGISKKSCHTL